MRVFTGRRDCPLSSSVHLGQIYNLGATLFLKERTGHLDLKFHLDWPQNEVLKEWRVNTARLKNN